MEQLDAEEMEAEEAREATIRRLTEQGVKPTRESVGQKRRPAEEGGGYVTQYQWRLKDGDDRYLELTDAERDRLLASPLARSAATHKDPGQPAEPAAAPAAPAPAPQPEVDAAPAADERVLTINNGGSEQTLTLPKPAWQATDDELVQAVKDSGAYLGKPGSKYDPYRAWREAHSEAITRAARDGKQFPDELLYDKPALIRTDLSDDQADLASDAMVDEYRATKDYGKAVAVYRNWGKEQPAAAPARDEAKIELRKRLSVLKALKECIG